MNRKSQDNIKTGLTLMKIGTELEKTCCVVVKNHCMELTSKKNLTILKIRFDNNLMHKSTPKWLIYALKKSDLV